MVETGLECNIEIKSGVGLGVLGEQGGHGNLGIGHHTIFILAHGNGDEVGLGAANHGGAGELGQDGSNHFVSSHVVCTSFFLILFCFPLGNIISIAYFRRFVKRF